MPALCFGFRFSIFQCGKKTCPFTLEGDIVSVFYHTNIHRNIVQDKGQSVCLSRCVVMQETQGLDNSLPTGLLGQNACALLSIVQNDLKFVLISTSNNDS